MGHCSVKLHALASKKTGDSIVTSGGPPPESLAPAEELALSLNQGCLLAEGIEGGTSSDVLPQGVREKYVQGILTATFPQQVSVSMVKLTGLYLSVTGDAISLLDPTEGAEGLYIDPCVCSPL